MKKMLTVGVTALKHVESPQSGWAVAHGLKKAGYRVVGIDDTPLTSAILSPLFDAFYSVPSLATENVKSFLEALRAIQEKEQLSVIFPCFDRDVFFFLKYRDDIEKLGIRLLLPQLKSLTQTSKPFLTMLATPDIRIPKTLFVSSPQELEQAGKKLGYPFMCKGVMKDAYIAKDPADALVFFEKIRALWHGGSGSILAQEFIAGDFYCVAGVSDLKHNLTCSVQMKKLGVDSKGSTWTGMTVHDSILSAIAAYLVKNTEWVGPFEFEFIKNYDNNKFYLFEINPRFPSWIQLATASGQNFPDIAARLALGVAVPPRHTYKNNLVFTRISEDLVFPLSLIEKHVKNLEVHS